MKFSLPFLLFLIPFCISGQTIFSDSKWKEYIEELAEETEQTDQIETLYMELSYLSEHPMELNSLTSKQLGRLPFLSDRQIEHLVAYRKHHGKMVSIYELKNVEGMDFRTLELILPFVYIGDSPVHKRPIMVDNLLKYGRNELAIRYDKGFQQKKGYKPIQDSILAEYPNRNYLGESFYNSLHYSYTFDDRIQGGVVAEKDAGEPFLNKHHRGYDYYSAHLLLKDFGLLKTLVVGDYKASFGQGLVISNDFSPSRNVLIAQAERRNNGFRRHYSTNENDYFRGLATTLSFKEVDVNLFYSKRRMDGIVLNDTITTFITDGLHRLTRERDKMNRFTMQTWGGNIRYAIPHLQVGLTALHYGFLGNTWHPEKRPYNLYYFRGKENTQTSIDYMVKNRNLKIYGETAWSANRAMATLNALQLTPASYISFLLLYRHYDKHYQSYFGNAFSQNTSVQNEQGLYMGLQFVPVAHWKLSAYADAFHFPWLKYGTSAPSGGAEYMIQADHKRTENNSFYVRYRYKQAEANETADSKTQIVPTRQHRARVQFLHDNSRLSFRSSLDGLLYEKTQQSNGWMLAQSVGYKPSCLPLELDIYAAYFDTDNYSSRIYSYEKTLPYIFSNPSFYGEGFRFALTARYRPVDRLILSAKLATTHYFDRETIGTDLEEIAGNDKTDMNVIARWKF